MFDVRDIIGALLAVYGAILLMMSMLTMPDPHH